MINNHCNLDITRNPEVLRAFGTREPFIRLSYLESDLGMTGLTINMSIALARRVDTAASADLETIRCASINSLPRQGLSSVKQLAIVSSLHSRVEIKETIPS